MDWYVVGETLSNVILTEISEESRVEACRLSLFFAIGELVLGTSSARDDVVLARLLRR